MDRPKSRSMRYLKKYFQYFIYGFLFMASLLIIVKCNGTAQLYDSNAYNDLEIDQKGIIKAAKTIETLFQNSDQQSLNEMLFEDMAESMKNIGNYTEEEMQAINKAFKNRKITIATENFAEFTYIIDGMEYTLTIGKNADGEWKIIRF